MTDYSIDSINMTMTLSNGTVLTIGNGDVMLGTFSLSDSSSTSTEFQLGTAIAKKLSFELNNYDDRFSDYDFVGAVVSASLSYTVGNILASANATVTNNLLELPNAHVDSANLLGSTAATESNGNTVTMENGIVTDTGASLDANGILTFGDGTLSNRDIIGINGGTVTAPVGVYYVVEKPTYNGGTIAFTALDCICLTDRVWDTSLTFPTTLQMIYNEICEYCNVPHLSQIIPDGGYVVQSKPAETTITCADMLCYISQLCGGFAHTDADGNLCIMQYGGVLHSIAQSFTSEIDTDDIIITGVSAIECFDETDDAQPGYFLAGSAGYVLAIAENPLVQQGDAQKAATFVNSVVHGMKFRPMHLTVPKDPTIHAGDAFIFTDRKGNQYGGYATNVNFNTNDVTTVDMDAKSPTEHNSVNYSSTTKTMSEVRRLTGTDAIFDRIYARGINADYINVGTLKGIRIEADEGLLGGWSIDDDGIEKIVQTSGNPYKVRLDAAQTGSDPFLVCYFQINDAWVPMMRIYPDGQAVFGNADYNGTFAVSPSTGLEYYRQGYGSLILRVGDESMEIIVHNEANSERVYISNGSVSIVDGTLQTTLWPGSIAMRDSSNYASMTATQLKNLLAKL